MDAPSLIERLEHWAGSQPSATFLKDLETGESLTYLQFLNAVRGFQRQLGAEPRTIVLALAGGTGAAVAWIAALTGGHLLIPCSPEATDDENIRLAAAYRPNVAIVASAGAARSFGATVTQAITAEQLNASIAQWSENVLPGTLASVSDRPDAGFVCLTTSGTTGTPKGVRLRGDQVAWTADQIRLRHQLTTGDRGLCVLPFFHINAPVVSLCTTLMAGGMVIVAPRFSRSRFWSWIETEHITWASIVPTILAVLLQTERPAWLPGSLRFVRTASAPLPLVQLMAFEKRFGIPVIETYGLSEAAATVAANPVPPERYKPGSVGLPLGVALRVCYPLDEEQPGLLLDVAPGEEGEVCISGPSVIAQYDNGASSTSFCGEWFRTGDLGHLDDDGYLFITGRMKDVINRGGEKIAPREVEEILLAHPLVRDAAVVPAPDPIYGQEAVAYVVLNQVDGSSPFPGLREFCALKLSAYKIPSRFISVAELPRTRTGKIQRHLVGISPEMSSARSVRYGVA
jgi:acyl-CoA synthetase (AMP-forming)/AMP-acid ligase II